MFDTKIQKDKWFRMGLPMINLSLVCRIFVNKKTLTFEFLDGKNNIPYEFHSEEDAKNVLEQCWEFIK